MTFGIYFIPDTYMHATNIRPNTTDYLIDYFHIISNIVNKQLKDNGNTFLLYLILVKLDPLITSFHQNCYVRELFHRKNSVRQPSWIDFQKILFWVT
jgi:hypothetical protein